MNKRSFWNNRHLKITTMLGFSNTLTKSAYFFEISRKVKLKRLEDTSTLILQLLKPKKTSQLHKPGSYCHFIDLYNNYIYFFAFKIQTHFLLTLPCMRHDDICQYRGAQMFIFISLLFRLWTQYHITLIFIFLLSYFLMTCIVVW